MNLLLLDTSYHYDEEDFELSLEQSRHIREVLRPAEEAVLRIGLENHGLSYAKVKRDQGEKIRLQRVSDWVQTAPPEGSRLILALPRPKSFRRLLRHAVVLGFKNIHFCHSYRVEKSYWSTPWIRPEEVRKEVLWGLQQAVDVWTPEVHFHRRFKPFFEDEVAGWLKSDEVALCAHPGGETWKGVSRPVGVLAFGPEGGWVDYEVNLMRNLGFLTASFSKRVLSCEAALPYIAGCLTVGKENLDDSI